MTPALSLEDTASADDSALVVDLDAVDRPLVVPAFALSELLPDFASDTDSSFAFVRARPRRLLGSALVMGYFLALLQKSASVTIACGQSQRPTHSEAAR
jgi:hypothetical protein